MKTEPEPAASGLYRRFAIRTVVAAVVCTSLAGARYRYGHGPAQDGPEAGPISAGSHRHEAGSHRHGEPRGTTHGASHLHPGHAAESAIQLSQTALQNIDFAAAKVTLSTFTRTVAFPAMVVERPGRSHMHIAAPLTGVVTRIHPIEGAAIEPGEVIFEIRLTHEELVAAQRDFLQSAESLDVIQREIERLRNVGDGVIAGRRIVEQQYEQQKLLASLRVARQALLLHGLTDEQIDQILATRKLLPSFDIRAPSHSHQDDGRDGDHLYHIQSLAVKVGQHVKAGELLCVLADHCELYLEGRAFEDDAFPIREAAVKGWDMAAETVSDHGQTDQISGLKLLHLSDQIDPESRVLRFYVRLPNAVVLDQATAPGRRFIAWRFNPGQRMTLHVPVESWPDRIVLPAEAVVEEGAEAYLFERNGDHFDRVAVQLAYRDQNSVVLASNDIVRPGDEVVIRGAYQMHLALKNRRSEPLDPHAGHSH